MGVCQYFLKGTCKFGNRCRNEHTSNNTSNNTGGFVGRPIFGQPLNDRYHFNAANKGFQSSSANVFGSQTKSSSYVHVDQNVILQSLRKELQEWDVNKVWPLSCFAAQREQKCLPGLEDTSPEELRLEAYKYQVAGKFETYLSGIVAMSNAVMSRRNELKCMSNESLLQEINATNIDASKETANNPFGSGKASSSLLKTGSFGTTSQAPQPSIFGSNLSSSASSSMFGSVNQNGGLLNSGEKTAISNPFGSSNTGLFTSNPAPSGGLFTSNPLPSGGLFTSSTAPSGGLFTSSTTTKGGLFGNASSGGLFGNSAPSGGLFGNASSATSNPFVTNTCAGSVFTNNSSSNVVANSEKSSSIFSAPFSNNVSSVSNPFGGSNVASTTGGLFSQPKPSGMFGASVTSPITSQVSGATVNPFLSANENRNQVSTEPVKPAVGDKPVIIEIPLVTGADIEKFKAGRFILGQIPTCPPPVELCG